MYRVARRALTAGEPGNSCSKICEIQLEVWGLVARLWIFSSWTIGHPFVESVSALPISWPLLVLCDQSTDAYFNRVFNLWDTQLGDVLPNDRARNSYYNCERK